MLVFVSRQRVFYFLNYSSNNYTIMMKPYSLFIYVYCNKTELKRKWKVNKSIKIEGNRVLKALCLLASFHPTIQIIILLYFLVSISGMQGQNKINMIFFLPTKNYNLKPMGHRRSELFILCKSKNSLSLRKELKLDRNSN